MGDRYFLLREKWLPVALEDGRRVFVRPCDITSGIEGQRIVRIDTGRADCDISLTEFLIGLLAVTIGPADRRDWLKRYREPPGSAELEKAFQPFEAAMILDGDGPRFFQDFDSISGREWPLDNLFGDAPGDKTTKENGDHFVKRGRFLTLSRAGVAVSLLSLQTIAPSGGSGQYTALRGPGPLSTVVVPGVQDIGGPNLWQRLWANAVPGFRASPGERERVFPWTTTTRTDEGFGVTTPENVHVGQCFFGMPRRIRLIFADNVNLASCDLFGSVDKVVATAFEMESGGTNYEAWGGFHPLSPHSRKPTEAKYRCIQLRSSRVGYRQWLDAVVGSTDRLSLPARAISEFARRADDLDALELLRTRVYAAGFVFKPGQANALDFGEALLPLIMTGNEEADEAVKGLARSWVVAADSVARQLSNSVRIALFGQKVNADKAKTLSSSTVLDGVRFRFWADTEDAFYAELRRAADSIEARAGELADHLDGLRQNASAAWLGVLKRHALHIFDDSVPIEDAESDKIEDVIAGRKFLLLALTGYGPVGKPLFEALSQPAAETKARKGRKAA